MKKSQKRSTQINAPMFSKSSDPKNLARMLTDYLLLAQAEIRHQHRKQYPILELCPKGSVLERTVQLTLANTDLPPSLTYFSAMTHLGSALCQNNFTIQPAPGLNIRPNLWVCALAGSGSGKTFTTSNFVQPIFASCEIAEVPETFTAAALFDFFCSTGLSREESKDLSLTLVEELKQKRCRGLLNRDEFGEFMRKINRQESAEEIKDYLLRTYDGKPLHRATRQDGERQTLPIAMSVYGTSVDETFFQSLREEDLLNGLMQRFLIVLAHDRPDYRMSLYTVKGISEATHEFQQAWQNTLAGPRNYTVTKQGLNLFNEWFHQTNGKSQSKESFVRRYAFAGWKYALILQAITEPDGIIGVGTIEIALRIIDRHLADLHTSLSSYTAINEWHIVYMKVCRYMDSHPNAARKNLLTEIRGIGTSKNLDVILQTIADAHFQESKGEHAYKLLKQSRC